MKNNYGLRVELGTHFTLPLIRNKCKNEVFQGQDHLWQGRAHSDTKTVCLPNFSCTSFLDFLWGCYKRTRKSFDVNLSTPDFRNSRTLWLRPSTWSSCQSIEIQIWKQISQDPWEEPWPWTLVWVMLLIKVLGLKSTVGQLQSDTHFLPRSLAALGGQQTCQ